MRRFGSMLATAAVMAGPAMAQPQTPDPVGDLLQRAQPVETPPGEVAPPPAEVRPYLPPAPPLSELAYESRVRASMASAQRFQGPLDGGWTLRSGAEPLYALQLVDKGTGPVEGAWRDLRRPGAPAASGFIESVERSGPDLVLRFGGRSAVLRASTDGRWSGELAAEGAARPATLTRN